MRKIILMCLVLGLYGCITVEELREMQKRGRAEIEKSEASHGKNNAGLTYLTISKNSATLCGITVHKSSSGHYFNSTGQRSYNIVSGVRNKALKELNLTPIQTATEKPFQIAFAEGNSFLDFSIYNRNGATLQRKKTFFEVNGRNTHINIDMPCSCYPRGDKPYSCNNRYRQY